MIPRIVVTVPTFDNPQSILGVVTDLCAVTELEIWVVDDGSKQPVSEIFRQAGLSEQRVKVLRHPENQGKGAALQTAFAEALRAGYTHVVSFDGDGQHLASQLPSMLAAARARPWDLIIGARRFPDQDVPGASRFGREFSNFWIRYETGVAVRDSQSGMRIYPLFFVQNLRFLTKRYDFEVEVLTRLIWSGVEVTEIDVDVCYPPASERVSHFHKFLDNTRISLLNIWLVTRSLFVRHWHGAKLALTCCLSPWLTHAPIGSIAGFLLLTLVVVVLRLNAVVALVSFVLGCLVQPISLNGWLGAIAVGGVLAAPLWMWSRRPRNVATWSGRSRGGWFGRFFLTVVCRLIGLRAAYFCLAFIAPYFYLFAPTGKRASLEYLRALFPEASPLRLRLRVVGHFFTFGLVLLDRLFCQVRGRENFKVHTTGTQELTDLIQEGSGAVIVTAHCGGWDLASSVLAGNHLGIRSTVAEFVNPTEHLTASKSVARLSVHNASLPILAFKEMLERGELVGMMADRPCTDKLVLVPFLGRLAAFDLTPFRLALSMGVPLFHGLSWRTGFESYTLELTPSPELGRSVGKLSAAEREIVCERAVRSFAVRLAEGLCRHPYQWFNFFPFFSRRPIPATPIVQALAKAPAPI